MTQDKKETWLLVADDERGHREMLRANLEHAGYRIMEVATGREAVKCVRTQHPDLVLMDMRMPELDGLGAVKEIRTFDQKVPILIMTAYGTIENAVQTLKAGAYDYILKPLDMEALETAIRQGLAGGAGVSAAAAAAAPEAAPEFVAASPVMRQLFQLADKVAQSEASVLLTGESGTGKEVFASYIQRRSRRADKPFVRVNCAALHDQLLESELFGHEKGAFTGAQAQRKGRFELADQGTIFLDEIGDMALETQAKILRALQQGTFERLGGTQTLKTDVRVISATNKDLARGIAEGTFREDLYYRLSVVPIHIPPLRERREDIAPLADFFMQRHAEKNRKSMNRITKDALALLLAYDWPGNVRELSNVMERAVILSFGDDVTPESLPANVREAAPRSSGELTVLERAERDLIVDTLLKCAGNRGQAAERLGMSRRTLYNKIHRYNLEGPNE